MSLPPVHDIIVFYVFVNLNILSKFTCSVIVIENDIRLMLNMNNNTECEK